MQEGREENAAAARIWILAELEYIFTMSRLLLLRWTCEVCDSTEELSGEDDKLRTEANDLSVDCQKVHDCLDSEGLSKLLEKLRDGLNFVFC